ncbi:MAG: PilZ domain-containing protein [Planctomycetota bacterium]|jgi:hypothetical protein
MNDQVVEKLTRDNLNVMLDLRDTTLDDENTISEQRRTPHWLTEGAIEFWPVDETWNNPWRGRCRNISCGGLGMSSDHYLEQGANIGLAIYFDETCFQGKAVVRYCQKVRDQFMIGVEFIFDE